MWIFPFSSCFRVYQCQLIEGHTDADHLNSREVQQSIGKSAGIVFYFIRVESTTYKI